MKDLEFENLLRSHLKFLQPGEEMDMDQDLKQLGLDSKETIDLLLDLEDRYNIILPDRYLTEGTFTTGRVIWEIIQALRQEQGENNMIARF